jgi:uncharacterized protein YndB with AHSA1/START domain
MKNEMTIDVARPAAAVFPYIEDTQKLPLWLSGFVAAHKTDVGPSRVTGSFRQLMNFGGRFLRLEGRLVAFEPDRQLSYAITSQLGDMRVDYRLEEEAGRTRLHYSCVTALEGVRRLFAPLVRFVLQRKIHGDLNRLKQVVEAAP